MSEQSPGPLAGVRVIDVGTRISAPFCAGLLGELGADVIKVELPGEGDFMRTIGPFVPMEDGADYSLFWAVEGRGRRIGSLAPRADEHDLVADVVPFFGEGSTHTATSTFATNSCARDSNASPSANNRLPPISSIVSGP